MVLSGTCSEKARVVIRVLKGSVLSLLFVFYISDVDSHLTSTLLKFADDTQVLSSVSTQDDINEHRSNLVLLGDWSNNWLALYNVDKCNVMQRERRNPLVSYSL